MSTDTELDPNVPQIPDAVADAWAAVYIDVYETLKARGELPDEEEDQPNCGDTQCPST